MKHSTLIRVSLAAAALAGTLASSHPARAASSQSRAFLKVELPKHVAYVGESLPVTIRAYYRGDTSVTVNGAPALTAAEVTLRAGDPTQGRAVIDGEPYLVLTWKDRLSPVKPGRYTLDFDVPSTLEWAPERNASTTMPDLGTDLFDDPGLGGGGDPFAQMQQRMQQMMNRAFSQMDRGTVQRKDVVLHAPAATLDVRPLPAAGRPDGFTGAVGHFQMTATAAPTHGRVGEPIELALHVRGEGSFDRVNVSGLAASPDWRTYTPSVTDGDGEKTFKQPIVPTHPGVQAIPPVSFSYFDPGAAKYVVLSSAPVPVEVTPGAATATASDGSAPLATTGPTLAPNDDAPGRPAGSLEPVFMHRWFWAAQSVPLAGLGAALLFVRRRRRLEADVDRPWRQKARRALREQRAAMDKAVARDDGTAFFAAARAALQAVLGARWHLEPSALSIAEIETRLGPNDVRELRPIFDADAARFSGVGSGESDLAHWKETVEHELAHIEHMESP